MAQLVLVIITFYQKNISPRLQVVFGPNFGCRYYPACSDYAHQAVSEQGLLRGGIKSLVRIVRCNPFFKGGVNFVD